MRLYPRYLYIQYPTTYDNLLISIIHITRQLRRNYSSRMLGQDSIVNLRCVDWHSIEIPFTRFYSILVVRSTPQTVLADSGAPQHDENRPGIALMALDAPRILEKTSGLLGSGGLVVESSPPYSVTRSRGWTMGWCEILSTRAERV